MNIVQLYLTTYMALDNLLTTYGNEDHALYLSDANPYLFKSADKTKRCISADPACYISFKEYMLKHFKDGIIPKDKSYNAVLSHLREYVGNVYPGVIKAFLTISKEGWAKIYDDGLEKFKDEKEENWQL